MGVPLTLRTGLPGNGKTLNAIKEIDIQASAEDRPVYYHNVRGLKADTLKAHWYEFDDPYTWFELPQNAIILIDEAQGFFGVRDPRKEVPDHCSRIETIRHGGHELHLVTQDHRMLDVHVRRLCGLHVHFKRIFNSMKIMRMSWGSATDFDKPGAAKTAQTTIIKLDKKMFGSYQSTQIGAKHHFKIKLPMAAYVLLGCAVFGGYFGLKIYSRYNEVMAPQTVEPVKDQHKQEPQQNKGIMQSVADAVTPDSAKQSSSTKEGPITTKEWVESRQPRIPNIPSSAPLYDELTKPVSFPRTYCVSTRNEDLIERNARKFTVAVRNGQRIGCGCYTQQGTVLKTDFEYCMNAVENGLFDPTLPDRTVAGPGSGRAVQAAGQNSGSAALPAANGSTFTSPGQVQSGVPVTVVQDGSYASRPWR